MALNPVRWFEIYVQDMNRAKKFYEAVFEVKLEKFSTEDIEYYSFPMHMNEEGSSGALVKMDDVKSGGNSIVIYFACEDCAVEESRVEKNGGKVKESKMSIGEHGHISLIYDTEGNLVGLHSMQ